MAAKELNENLPMIFTEDQVNFLLQRTPKEEIRQRKGPGGITLNYVTQQYVTRLLNKVFGFNWDFDVLWEQIGKREVIVKGRLTVRAKDIEISKTQFGGAEIKRYKENGNPLSVANDLKAAASDALKKCASLLGIGLDLYDSEVIEVKEVERAEEGEVF